MGAKMDHSYLYNNPEFMFNLLKRLNTTVAKNPTILMPFVKQFQSYTPQTFENTPYTPYAMPRPLPRPNEFLLPFSNFVQQPFSANDAAFRQNIFSNYGTQNNFQQNNNMNYGVRNLPAYSLIEHIAQTTVKPSMYYHQQQQPYSNYVSDQNYHQVEPQTLTIHQSAISQQQQQQPALSLHQPALSIHQPALTQQPTTSMVDNNQLVKNTQYVPPVTIQDLIAQLLENPNNPLLKQKAQPFLTALVNSFTNSSSQHFDSYQMYKPIHISNNHSFQEQMVQQINLEDKKVENTQSFKPYKKTAESTNNSEIGTFHPIDNSSNDNNSLSIYNQSIQLQNPYFIPQPIQPQSNYNHNQQFQTNGTFVMPQFYDPNINSNHQYYRF